MNILSKFSELVDDEIMRSECGAVDMVCPPPCKCNDGIVDCREKMLTKIPNFLPEDITEL
jgi:hypothetical protein